MESGIRWVGCEVADHARWLHPYRYPFAFDADGSSWLSTRFRHAVRILHPAYMDRVPVTWDEISTARGVPLGVRTSFYDLTGSNSPNHTVVDIFDTPPEQGSLPEEALELVYGALGDAGFGLLWEGFHDPGLSERLAVAATVRSDATVYKAISVSDSPTAFTLERSPSFWWPESHSWCAATGLDSFETLVASSNTQLLGSLASIGGIEVQPIR